MMDDKTQQALAKLTYGIYILTTRHGIEKHGMIASWVSQVAHNPPLVMVAVKENRRIHPILKEAGAFALHVLEKNERRLISQFKLPSPAERFAGLECAEGKTGVPILKGALAYLECRLWKTVPAGGHTLFIGEVVSGSASEGGNPMTGWDYGKVYRGED